jgi:hypothetical protein
MALDSKAAELAHSLYNFIKEKYGFEEDPEIEFIEDEENAQNILGYTGHYDPSSKKLAVYITGRHPKDVLRSFAHELMHHVQEFEGMNTDRDMTVTRDPNYIMKDKHMEKIEADAFERGNVTFRQWEAYQKGYKDDKGKEQINEVHIPKKKLPKYKKELSKTGEIAKKNYSGDAKWKVAATIAKNAVGLEEENKMAESKKEETKEVEVNEALQNAHAYLPEERVCGEAYNSREEKVYNELLKKFGIKK